MSNWQKIIIYISLAFAFFLAINILFIIIFGLSMLTSVFSQNKDSSVILDEKISLVGIENITVNVETSDIFIKTSSEFSAHLSSDNFIVKSYNNNFSIEEKNSFLKNQKRNKIVFYIPDSTLLENLNIESGIGKVEIELLLTKNLNIELGIGQININNISVTKDADINIGVGIANISNALISELSLESGIGSTYFAGKINNDSEFDFGIGKMSILLKDKDLYKIIASKGLGSFFVDGKKLKSDNKLYHGSNVIEINSGIGNTSVNFN